MVVECLKIECMLCTIKKICMTEEVISNISHEDVQKHWISVENCMMNKAHLVLTLNFLVYSK